MAEQFGLEPDELRGGATRVSEPGSRVNGVMSAAQALIAAKGPVWGGNTLGGQFGDGPNGFVSQLARAAASVCAKAALVNYYAERLTHTADVSERSEQG
jgi:hypothetical protein